MSVISTANFNALVDSICAQYQQVVNALGTSTTNPSAAYGAQQNLTRILALNDAQQILALLPQGQTLPGNLTAVVEFAARYSDFIGALRGHVGGSIDKYLTTNAAQCGPEFAQLVRQLGYALTPANVFNDLVDPAGSFTASGAGAGAFTAGSSVDGTKYSGGSAQLVLTAAQGAAGGTYTVTLSLAAGGTVNQTQAVPGNTANGTSYNLPAGTSPYLGVTNITYSGGQANDACKIRLPRLRAATL